MLMKLAKMLSTFTSKNFLLAIFIASIFFVGFVGLLKFVSKETRIVYAKIRVGQGFWWARTAGPKYWYISAIKKGDQETSLTGSPIAEVLEVRYYPYGGFDQFNAFLKVRLRAGYDKNSNQYTFKRDPLMVGSPIELDLSSAMVTGTVTELSTQPIKDNYVEKIIYLINHEGYSIDLPETYQNIKIGDQYYDGEEVVFEVLDKSLRRGVSREADLYGRPQEYRIGSSQSIVVKAKVKVKEKDGRLFYGEEQLLKVNNKIVFETQNYIFDNFIVKSVEEPDNT